MNLSPLFSPNSPFFINFASVLHFILCIMNKRSLQLFSHAMLTAICLLISSCSEDNPWVEKGVGYIAPKISTSVDIKRSTSTRAENISAPDAAQFALSLEKADGSIKKNWPTFSAFQTDEKFKIGTYTMAASYGNIDEEGIERPYFYGEATFDVKEDQTTEVNITASLANSMVSVIYTDAFKKYFTDWSATLHSEGGAYIAIPKGEDRPVYVKPGNISLLIAFTKQNGNAATYQPAEFKALPRHHYKLTFDVNGGEIGDGKLVITFDDSLEEDDVEIDLSDEMITAPAPEITPKGCSFASPLEMLEYSSPAEPVKFFIRAKSGIKEAKLTINSAHKLPLGNEFDICSLSELQLAQLSAAGIIQTGLSRNPGTIAEINISNLIGLLPAGNHEITLVVKDKNTKVNDPVTLTITSTPLTLEVVQQPPLPAGETTASLTMAFNGTDLASNLSIEAIDDYGAWQPCTITKITPKATTQKKADPFPLKQYSVDFSLPSATRDIQYRIKYAGIIKASGTISRIYPEYNVSIDPYSRKAVIYIHPENEAYKATIVDNLRVFASNTELAIAARNESIGYVIVSGLQPSQNYEIKTTLRSGNSPTFNDATSITTEAASTVPNGNFETLVEKYNIESMTQGGPYTRTLIGSSAHNTQTLKISEPQYWATTNPKTLNLAASTQNSWFVLPSVFNSTLYFQSKTHFFTSGFGGDTSTPDAYSWSAANGNNAMVIRNVAYDPAGKEPSTDKKTATPTGYYCKNVPTIAYRAAGKLFLGSYSYSSGTETYNEGISFTSRPSSLTGMYRFHEGEDAIGEKATVKIELLNGSDVIGTGYATLAPNTSDFGTFTVNITYTVAHLKATSLRIMFASSDATGTITQETNNIKTTAHASLFEQESRGSVLVVDNLVFNY